MLNVSIIVVIGVLLSLIFISPKLGTYLIWPILFIYPHKWWYYHQILPWNIGADDLFCIALFLAVVIRRNFFDGVPIRFGYAFWGISSFLVVVVIANLAGYRDIMSEVVRIDSIKDMLKLGIYWCLFYAILHCIDDIRDLKIQFTMFSISIVASALLVIAQYYYPYQMDIFAPAIAKATASGEGTRVMGAFLNSNSAACMLASSLMLVIASLRLQRSTLVKIAIYSAIFILFMGIMLTKSRSGLLSLGSVVLFMGIVGRSKRMAWLILVAAILVSLGLPGFRGAFLRRIQRTSDIREDTSVVGRRETWKSYFATASAKTYILGRGVSQTREIHGGTESHSTYVSLITIYGMGGVIWAMLMLLIFFRKTLALRNFPDPLIGIVSSGCMWALICWGIYSIMADAINTPHPRYLLFYLVVLVDRTYIIALQQSWFTHDAQQEAAYEMQYEDVESY